MQYKSTIKTPHSVKALGFGYDSCRPHGHSSQAQWGNKQQHRRCSQAARRTHSLPARRFLKWFPCQLWPDTVESLEISFQLANLLKCRLLSIICLLQCSFTMILDSCPSLKTSAHAANFELVEWPEQKWTILPQVHVHCQAGKSMIWQWFLPKLESCTHPSRYIELWKY